MSRVRLSLDGARKLNRPAVQKKLFGKGCFTGVRMRNDRKRAPAFNFFLKIGHSRFVPFHRIAQKDFSFAHTVYYYMPFPVKPQEKAVQNRTRICKSQKDRIVFVGAAKRFCV